MTQKPIVPREKARRDIEAAIDYYREEAGTVVADRFITSLRGVNRSIARHPKLGSPFFEYELHMPGLRSRRLANFPYVVLYFEKEDRIDVWRVLHTRRDIASLSNEGGP